MKKQEPISIIALAISAISYGLWSYFLSLKYFRFGYDDWDLANLTQALWNIAANGSQYFSLGDFNIFGDHANYIALLFVPLFKIIPHPLVLIITKVLAFHAAALSLYYISQKFTNSITGLLVMLTFLVFPPNIFAMIYEFNFDCIGMVLLIWLIYFYLEEKYKAFMITALFSVLIKENVYLILFMCGFFSLFKDRNKLQWGIIPIALSLTLFYVVVMHIIPHYRELQTSAFVTRYSYLGEGVGEIIRNIIFDPANTITLLFDPLNIKFVLELFGATLPFSLASPNVLLLATPLWAQHFLSTNLSEHTIRGHYSHLLVPFIFLSYVHTLEFFLDLFKRPKIKLMVSIAIAVFALSLYSSFGYKDEYLQRLSIKDRQTAKVYWKLVKSIPADASVIATFEFLAPLSRRERLYSFHKIYDDRFQSQNLKKRDPFMQKENFILPDHVSYAIFNFDEYFLRAKMNDDPEITKERIERFFHEDSWAVMGSYGSAVLLKRISPQNAAKLDPDKDYVTSFIHYERAVGDESGEHDVSIGIRTVK